MKFSKLLIVIATFSQLSTMVRADELSFEVVGLPAAMLTDALNSTGIWPSAATTVNGFLEEASCRFWGECFLIGDKAQELKMQKAQTIYKALKNVRDFSFESQLPKGEDTLLKQSESEIRVTRIKCTSTGASSFYKIGPSAKCTGTIQY